MKNEHPKKGIEKMANEQNLRPIRTSERAKELGQRGGVKSGETRRKKKLVRTSLKTMMSELGTDNRKKFVKDIKKILSGY